MPGNLPPTLDGGSTPEPPAPPQWAAYTGQRQQRLRTWPATVLAGIAAVLAAAALIVTLAYSRSVPAQSTRPTFTAAETAAAQRQLCDTYKLAARAVQVDTHGADRAVGRIALTNAAAMVDNAAADPALDASHRDAARNLAAAYRTTTAMGSIATDAEWQGALDDVNAKDAAMKKVCGAG